jgi:hypothetical protein
VSPSDDDLRPPATPLSRARGRARRRPQPSRTGARFALLARGLAFAIGLWLLWLVARLVWGGGIDTPEPVAVPQAAPPPAVAAIGVPPPVPAAPPPPLRAEARPPTAPAPPPVFDLCGVGRMPMPVPIPVPGLASAPGGAWPADAATAAAEAGETLAPGDPLPPSLGRLARAEAWPLLLAQLDAGDEGGRAAAWVLRASGLMDMDTTPGWPGPDAGAAAALDRRAPVEALAQLAADSRDAGIHRWALALCERQRHLEQGPGAATAAAGPGWLGGSACERLSAHDLAELDPDDAHGWLVRAHAAADEAARTLALQRAATAARWRTTPPGLIERVDAAWPESLPGYLRSELLLRALGAELSIAEGAPVALLRHCRGSTGTDRAPLCSDLATMAAERGDSLIALVLGARLGQEAGWPGERVQALRDEFTRLQARAAALESDQPWSCREVARLRGFLRLRADEGELAALRAAGSAHGR